MNTKEKIEAVQTRGRIMEVTIKEEKLHKVSLSSKEAEEITIRFLQDKFKFAPIAKQTGARHYGDIIQDGNVVARSESCGGSHCWEDNYVKREATEMDYALALILKKLA